MATKTSNYEFNKPKQNDFYDVDVQNENWDKVDEELSEFDDSGVTEDIKSFPDFLSKFVTGNKVAITLRNLKAGLQFVLHAGQIVNNCVTDNTGLPLSAAQGKALKDLIDTTNNNLSNKADKTSLSNYVSKDDLGVFLTASGTKAAVFRGYVEITNLKLYARHTYLILGKAEASMTVSLIAAIIGFPSSGYGTSYSLGMSRSTGANGGGCVTAAIITLTKDCTISLQGYGYDNATYDYQGFLMAIQLK